MLAGCQNQKNVPWEKFADLDESAYKPQAGTSNAWDRYLLAANLAEKSVEKYQDQADIRSNQRTEYLSRINNSLNMAIQASSMSCTPQYVAQDPFLPRKAHAGLSAIGRGLQLKIDNLAEANSLDATAPYILTAHRMSNHLSGGDAQDALLGYWIAAESRRSAINILPRMSAGALNNLGNAILSSLQNTPPLSMTLDHELQAMLGGVQFVSNAKQNNDYKLLETALYKQAAPAIDYLKNLKEDERPEYFQTFAQEARNRIDHVRSISETPVVERKEFTVDKGADRPWKRFAAHIFTPLDAFVAERDLHIARSRLFALTCLALAAGKSQGIAPAQFKNIPKDALIDPYSGKPFPYHIAGREFRIYSVGTDGRDDGGESNSENREPDLLIEPSRN